MHVLSAEQFGADELQGLFQQAEDFRQTMDYHPNGRRGLMQRHLGTNLCNLFYEPSTRTRVSFGTAADNLGVKVQQTENAGEFSSAAKGETLEDNIQVLNEYGFDIIVLRHPETGSANRAAAVSRASIINAGDGSGEHPTQSLLDAYTIHNEFGRLSDLDIVMGGDLRHGRTVCSLAKLLSRYADNHICFVSTPDLQIGDDITDRLEENGTSYLRTTDMYDVLSTADVVYWTRLQKERMQGNLDVGAFTIDAAALEVMKPDAIIMHPLPRVGEIDPSVDSDPRAKYFEQAGNGLYIRMALIDQILTNR